MRSEETRGGAVRGWGPWCSGTLTHPARLPQPHSGSDWTQRSPTPRPRAPAGDVGSLLNLSEPLGDGDRY